MSLPLATRSWRCAYFRLIIVTSTLAVTISLVFGVHFSWHIVVALLLCLEIGWLVGKRDNAYDCALKERNHGS
jgi:hypothetical protein